MPGTNERKLEEMTKALELIRAGKARITNATETWYIGFMESFRKEL